MKKLKKKGFVLTWNAIALIILSLIVLSVGAGIVHKTGILPEGFWNKARNWIPGFDDFRPYTVEDYENEQIVEDSMQALVAAFNALAKGEDFLDGTREQSSVIKDYKIIAYLKWEEEKGGFNSRHPKEISKTFEEDGQNWLWVIDLTEENERRIPWTGISKLCQ